MDLKFSFGGASPDHHDHGGAPSGIPLPFAGSATVPVSHSSELDVIVRSENDNALIIAEVVTRDGVTYSRGDVNVADAAPAALARAARSAISRAVAGLEGPLAEAITSIRLEFAGASDALAELEVDTETPVVTDALQMRLGVNTGVPIRLA